MILISVAFLFVSLFGAYAYGAATLFSIRRVSVTESGAAWIGRRLHCSR